LTNRVQLTTDGHRAYLEAVEERWEGYRLRHAIKLYGEDRHTDARYSPAECIGCKEIGLMAGLIQAYLRLRRAPESNHAHVYAAIHSTDQWILKEGGQPVIYSVALHYMWYNFARSQTLRVTPAMEAGIADHVWTIEEIVDLLKKRGPWPPNRQDGS